MTLAPGSRLGSYDIVALIGVGGMGEVYRARDERLKRDVALKVLPEAFAHDENRVARFEREAQALASLNHPHIGGIHELAEHQTTRYLVLELVEGQTLASHLVHGPMAVPEALRIARQILDALDAAHEKGVVHRDLKPSNVMLRADGTVKVLDFGLAKLTVAEGAGASAFAMTNSPTALTSMTGTILGTAAYMSPEQATGRPVDKRADIWAFGVLMYEMLTGKNPFQAATVQETIAAVLKEEPDLRQIPEQVRPLLDRCLAKDPRRRLRDVGDAALLLDNTSRRIEVTSRSGWLWTSAALVLALAAAVAMWAPWRRPPVQEITRLQALIPENDNFAGSLDLSRDGRKLVFAAAGSDGRRRLWLRDMDSLTSRPIPGADLHGDFAGAVSWSRDGRNITFADGNRLLKVDVLSSTPPVTIAELPVVAGESTWNEAGDILIGGISAGPIWRVSQAGGEATPVTALMASESAHGFPYFLPDGRHFLYFRTIGARGGIYLGSLDIPPEGQSSERLMASDSQALYVPSTGTGSARLLFARQGRLLSQSFDATRLILTGEPEVVAPSVGSVGSRSFFTASDTGALAYMAGITYRLIWVDRTGRQLERFGESTAATYARLSPDGARIAFDRADERGADIWLTEISRDVTTRLSLDSARDEFPVWSPDGARLVFRSERGGVFDLYEKAADGTGEERLVLRTDFEKWPTDWSHDGRYVVYEERTTQEDLWVLPMDGDRNPVPLTRTAFSENHARWSPDDRWIAYQSMQSGRWEVYIQPFVPPGSGAQTSTAVYQVSRDGGQLPVWRGDGKELVYVAADDTVVALDVTTSPRIQTGAPRPLFRLPVPLANFPRLEMRADGQRFLIRAPNPDGPSAAFTVVLNWQAALRN